MRPLQPSRRQFPCGMSTSSPPTTESCSADCQRAPSPARNNRVAADPRATGIGGAACAASPCSLGSAGTLSLCLPLGFRPAGQEVFQYVLAVCRREGLLANLAMDYAMRNARVRFHAHDLVARPAAAADEVSWTALGHGFTPCGLPLEQT